MGRNPVCERIPDAQLCDSKGPLSTPAAALPVTALVGQLRATLKAIGARW